MTEIRRLARAEIPLAPALLQPEGWEFDLPELERLDRIGGLMGAFEGTELVAFLSYHDEAPVRWIGNVVTIPQQRGKGLGERLVRASLGPQTTGLYAVEKAVTLYARIGFVAQGEAFATRAQSAVSVRAGRSDELRAADLPEVVRLDHAVTGMDRRGLLHELVRAFPKTLRVVRRGGRVTGYGVAKTSSTGTELGPIVAEDAMTRDAILDDLLHDAPAPYEASALGATPGALEALDERGLRQRFRAIPMFLGPPPAWDPARIVCVAGLEKG